MSGDLPAAKSRPADLRAEITNARTIRAVIQRGIDRGEVDPDRLTPRIVALATDLARHEMLMTLKPLPDEVIREIVDDIFLPLVRGMQTKDHRGRAYLPNCCALAGARPRDEKNLNVNRLANCIGVEPRSSLRAERSNPGIVGCRFIPGSPRRFAPRDDGSTRTQRVLGGPNVAFAHQKDRAGLDD